MTTPQSGSPFQSLNLLLLELTKLSQAGDWEKFSILARKINLLVQSDRLGKANLSDRHTIEQSLQHLETCLHKAEPNRDDIARLLTGFGIDLGH